MPRPIKNLTNMEIDEISLVDKGANQHAMIAIAKRAPEEDAMPDELFNQNGELLDLETLKYGDIVFDEAGTAYELVEDEAEVTDPELAEVGKAFAPGMAFGGASQKATAMGHAAGSAARKATKNPFARGAVAGGAAGGAAGFGAGKMKKSFSEEIKEELSKAFTEEDRDAVLSKAFSRVEQLETAQAEAIEIAKSERDLRLTREYISKAADYNLPVDANELGPVLYRMTESMSYEDCSVIAKCLEGAGAMIFQEQGYIGGGDNGDVLSEVNARAAEIAKSADGVKPEHFVAVFDQSPEAYDQYRAAQRGL